MKLSFATATLALAVVACAPAPEVVDQAAVEAAVEEAWDAFEEAWEAGDAAAVALLYTEDAINMINYSFLQHGREEIEAAFSQALGQASYELLEQSTTEVIAAGGWAYELGTLRQAFTAPGEEPVVQDIRYTSLFRLGEDGVWRFHRWMGQFTD